MVKSPTSPWFLPQSRPNVDVTKISGTWTPTGRQINISPAFYSQIRERPLMAQAGAIGSPPEELWTPLHLSWLASRVLREPTSERTSPCGVGRQVFPISFAAWRSVPCSSAVQTTNPHPTRGNAEILHGVVHEAE